MYNSYFWNEVLERLKLGREHSCDLFLFLFWWVEFQNKVRKKKVKKIVVSGFIFKTTVILKEKSGNKVHVSMQNHQLIN